MRLVVTLLALLSACTCRQDELRTIHDSVHLPVGVDCGRIRVGSTVAVDAHIDNTGVVPVENVSWQPQGVSVDAPSQLVVGDNTIVVHCTALTEGPADGLITFAANGSTWQLGVSWEGALPPSCAEPSACHRISWSDDSNRCEETPLDDGTSCQLADTCLVQATCTDGRCTGHRLDCDDHDACTIDSCVSPGGCQHFTRHCRGDGICKRATCDPRSGCGLADEPDGTPCGPIRTCSSAQICVSGECVLRKPPDGFICAEESPCQPAGLCHDEQCVQPPAKRLEPTWSHSVPTDDAGANDAFSDLLVRPSGQVSGSSYFMSVPTLALNEAPISVPQGSARRCIFWANSMACADYPASLVAAVSRLSLTDGATQWSYSSVLDDVPLFKGPTVQVFLARLAVLSDNELLALFESRTIRDGADPRCRRFAMIVLDGQGQRIAQTVIEHSIFDVCTHPHSYGLAVDAARNVYLSFAPSDVDNPATAIDGTVLLAYSPTLERRWVVEERALVGGELAVASGRLFHERSTRVWSTATGQPVGELPLEFGFGVVSANSVLPAPMAGGHQATSVALDSLQPRWVQPLSAAAGGPVHLASLRTSFGERTVMLVFTDDSGSSQLQALDATTGASYFSCPITLPERPVQSALTAGQLTVLSGAVPASIGWSECDRCDPRWARTRNAFRTYSVPGLSPADAPWPGPWGGIDHDHREDSFP